MGFSGSDDSSFLLALPDMFGRFRSSKRNSERATIQNLFSKHQHIKRLRRKRPLHLSVCVLSLLMGILKIGSFVVAAPPRNKSTSFKSYQSTKHFHSTPFSSKWFWKIIFVPPLKWYCNFLLETLSQEDMKGSKGRKGLGFFSLFPSQFQPSFWKTRMKILQIFCATCEMPIHFWLCREL